ncbi:MAG TPA: GTPase, partial [Pseudomonadales bacterium]
MSLPRFAIVGHPNKGKSSIVATLAEDATVAISPEPGTTTAARAYPMRVDGVTLYELVDTPGFQRARDVLAWLHAHDRGADARASVVAEFVQHHAADPRYRDECELLRPILAGAGILYVVDGSRPYGPEYEPEMEVLRWTGRPRLALINLIASGDHVEEWR